MSESAIQRACSPVHLDSWLFWTIVQWSKGTETYRFGNLYYSNFIWESFQRYLDELQLKFCCSLRHKIMWRIIWILSLIHFLLNSGCHRPQFRRLNELPTTLAFFCSNHFPLFRFFLSTSSAQILLPFLSRNRIEALLSQSKGKVCRGDGRGARNH